MGEDNWRVIEFVTPPVHAGTAPRMVTVDPPLMIKSDPSDAIELQFIDSLKSSRRDMGEQVGGLTIPIASGGRMGRLNWTTDPAGTGLLQVPSKVFPSLPFVT